MGADRRRCVQGIVHVVHGPRQRELGLVELAGLGHQPADKVQQPASYVARRRVRLYQRIGVPKHHRQHGRDLRIAILLPQRHRRFQSRAQSFSGWRCCRRTIESVQCSPYRPPHVERFLVGWLRVVPDYQRGRRHLEGNRDLAQRFQPHVSPCVLLKLPDERGRHAGKVGEALLSQAPALPDAADTFAYRGHASMLKTACLVVV